MISVWEVFVIQKAIQTVIGNPSIGRNRATYRVSHHSQSLHQAATGTAKGMASSRRSKGRTHRGIREGLIKAAIGAFKGRL